MAFVAQLSDDQVDKIYEAVFQYSIEEEVPTLRLFRSINIIDEKIALELLKNVRSMVEFREERSGYRHFYTRHNDRIFHIYTDRNLHYQVEELYDE